jgi:GNAT superfamily N-acetyltransferase
VRIGPDYRESHTLSDGRVITIRPIKPEDREALHAEFLRLTPESRYRRFFAHLNDLTDGMLTYLTELDGTDHFALVATTDSPDLKSERGVGVARFVRLAEERDAAEAAVIVVDDMQHSGIGRLLSLALVAAALERNVRRFSGEVLASNEPMLEALRTAGAKLAPAGAGTVRFDLPVRDAKEPALRRLLREAARSLTVFLRRLPLSPSNGANDAKSP